jgi:hypothetical protein
LDSASGIRFLMVGIASQRPSAPQGFRQPASNRLQCFSNSLLVLLFSQKDTKKGVKKQVKSKNLQSICGLLDYHHPRGVFYSHWVE